MFHLWHINIPLCHKDAPNRNHRRAGEGMNGESRKEVAVAIVSFAIGAVVAVVLGNPKARERLAAVSKRLAQKTDVA